MRQTNKKMLLEACKLSFEGKTDVQIAEILDINVSAMWRWRKNPLWVEFEQELLDAHKQSLIQAHVSATLSDERHPTQ